MSDVDRRPSPPDGRGDADRSEDPTGVVLTDARRPAPAGEPTGTSVVRLVHARAL